MAPDDLPDVDARHPGVDAALRSLLEASYGMFPDELATAVAAAVAQHLGGRDVELYLVDLDQVELRPLGPDPDRPPEPVDGSAAGLAFRRERTVVEPDADGSRRLWVPILDSAERLGVLGATDDGSIPVRDWMVLTSLLGELVTSKSAYGDAVVLTRRSHPLALGAEMRWSVLPPLTFTSPQVTISGILQPSHLVSGDAFDYTARAGHASVAMFDAMGHGLEASRIANLAIGGFRHARRHGASPAEALAQIDAVIAEQIGDARFATGQIADLDLETGAAQVVTAGHPPPLVLRRSGAVEEPRVRPGLPLGLGPVDYEATEVRLEPGEALVIHSDGVTEARSPGREEYGAQRLGRRLSELFAEGVRPAETLRIVMREVLEFQAGDVRDDATLVLVRWMPESIGLPGVPAVEDPIVLEPGAAIP